MRVLWSKDSIPHGVFDVGFGCEPPTLEASLRAWLLRIFGLPAPLFSKVWSHPDPETWQVEDYTFEFTDD
jgi:hypothetical protein